jgi:hypothetical protein
MFRLSALKMEATGSSETFVNIYQTIFSRFPEDNICSHLHENLKRHM